MNVNRRGYSEEEIIKYIGEDIRLTIRTKSGLAIGFISGILGSEELDEAVRFTVEGSRVDFLFMAETVISIAAYDTDKTRFTIEV